MSVPRCAFQGPCYCAAGKRCSPEVNSPTDCKYFTVVSEYRAAGKPRKSTTIAPEEVKKWWAFGRPNANHNGGMIWFGPDGSLFLSSGTHTVLYTVKCCNVITICITLCSTIPYSTQYCMQYCAQCWI